MTFNVRRPSGSRIHLGGGITASSGGGADWQDVAQPDAAFAFVPFTVQQLGRAFRPNPTFNLQTYAAVSVTKTYYVDKALGNNGNTGADWANALQTIGAAFGKADVDRVYVRDGDYFYFSERAALPARNLEVIGVGGKFTISNNVYNEVGAFTPVSNHYNATVGGSRTVARMEDTAFLDVNGNNSVLTVRASEALVDANPGSFFQSGTTIYVRTHDSRVPDSSLFYGVVAPAVDPTANNRTIYFENVKIERGLRLRSSSSTGGLKAYFRNCEMQAITVSGAAEVIMWGAQGRLAVGDLVNIDILNTVVPKVIEIDCDFGYCGAAASDQASTSHNGSTVVRIQSAYHHTAGQCIADVGGTGKVWMLGCENHHSTSGIGFYSGVNMWLDCCWSHDNGAFDIQNEVGETVFIRDFIGEKGVNSIAGTLAAY